MSCQKNNSQGGGGIFPVQYTQLSYIKPYSKLVQSNGFNSQTVFLFKSAKLLFRTAHLQSKVQGKAST